MPDISVLTKYVVRAKLAKLCDNDQELIKFFENVFTDISSTLPNYSTSIEEVAATALASGALLSELRDDVQNLKSQISQIVANIPDQSETDAKLLTLGESLQKAIDYAESLAYNGIAKGSLEQKQVTGTVTLVAGAATVTYPISATSRIFLTSQVDGGTVGFLRVSARTVSTNFTITSSSVTDTSTVAYLIIEA